MTTEDVDNNNNNENNDNNAPLPSTIKKPEEEISKLRIYSVMATMVITGALNTIFLTLQNKSFETILGAPYSHPWFQTSNMFVGEFYCVFIWLGVKYQMRKQAEQETTPIKEEDDKRPEIKPWLFLITCLCDVVGTTLLNFALINMATSIFQMLRGGIIIITCLFSMFFLKKYQKRHNWLGVGLVFLGVFLVGLSSQIYKNKDEVETKVLGIILLITSLLFAGFQFVFQEKILTQYKCNPIQLVAWEGSWGLLIFIILLPIFQFIKCDANMAGVDNLCSRNTEGVYFVENTSFVFQQLGAEPILIAYILLQTVSICFFNLSGIFLTKYVSSPARAIMDATRTILVWLFFLVSPVGRESFIWLQLVGFIILLLGNVIYNEILEIPFWGLNYYTKRAMKERGELEENLMSDDEKQLNTRDSSVKPKQ